MHFLFCVEYVCETLYDARRWLEACFSERVAFYHCLMMLEAPIAPVACS